VLKRRVSGLSAIEMNAEAAQESQDLYAKDLRHVAQDYFVVRTLCKRLVVVELELYRARRLCRAWAQALTAQRQHTPPCMHEQQTSSELISAAAHGTCPYREAMLYLFRQVAETGSVSEYLRDVEHRGARASSLKALLESRSPPTQWTRHESASADSSAASGLAHGNRVQSQRAQARSANVSDGAERASAQRVPAPSSSEPAIMQGQQLPANVGTDLSQAGHSKRPLQFQTRGTTGPEMGPSRTTTLAGFRAAQMPTNASASQQNRWPPWNEQFMEALMESERDTVAGLIEQERLQTQLNLLRGVMMDLEVLLERCPCEDADGAIDCIDSADDDENSLPPLAENGHIRSNKVEMSTNSFAC